MHISFDYVITDLEGKPFPDGDKSILLGGVCSAALLATYTDEPALTGEEKFQRYCLAQRVYAKGEVEVSSEDLVRLRTLTGKFCTPSLLGPVWQALDGKAYTPKAQEPPAPKAPRKPRAVPAPTTETAPESTS